MGLASYYVTSEVLNSFRLLTFWCQQYDFLIHTFDYLREEIATNDIKNCNVTIHWVPFILMLTRTIYINYLYIYVYQIFYTEHRLNWLPCFHVCSVYSTSIYLMTAVWLAIYDEVNVTEIRIRTSSVVLHRISAGFAWVQLLKIEELTLGHEYAITSQVLYGIPFVYPIQYLTAV